MDALFEAPAMKRSISLLLAAIAALLPSRASAQTERFEVGRRLRAFEAAWEEKASAENRKRAVEIMKQATIAFLTNRPVEAGLALDQARFALRDAKEISPESRWAESLALYPVSRLLDTGDKLGFTLTSFYHVETGVPKGARLDAGLFQTSGKQLSRPAPFPVAGLPLTGDLELGTLAEGDYLLRGEVSADGKPLARSERMVSRVVRLNERLEKLKDAVKALPKGPATTDEASVRALIVLLEALYQRKPQETNYPAAHLLAEAQAAVAAIAAGKTYYGHEKTGQFWLTLATARGPAPIRLLAPAAVKQGKPLPLLIALHGAGGSENMFFDAYGRGAIVRLCEERGWLLVAPRSGFGRAAPLPEIIDAVNRLYPVDAKRVFLIGHSMGAAQAVSAAGQAPERFAGVAALAGGGTVRESEGLKAVPFFVGAGSEDFLLSAARSLRLGLQKAGVKKLEYREYPDVEHVLVVQVGLKDVFAFFESAR